MVGGIIVLWFIHLERLWLEPNTLESIMCSIEVDIDSKGNGQYKSDLILIQEYIFICESM
jgi:hypothetical protein